jgi:hypothetical protein
MNAISVSIMTVLIAVVLAAPRRWAILGMAGGVLCLTQYTSIDVLGFNLFPVRFLEVACFVRVIARREFIFSNLTELDYLFLLVYSYTTIVFLLRSTDGQAYQVGLAVDASMCYFIFRGLIRDIHDFRWFLRAFAVLLIPYVALLLVEMLTGQRPFSLLGGPAIVEWYREGRVRCIGSFRNPSLLGTLGASFLPLYIGLAIGKMDRIWGRIGIVLCAAIAFLSNSGGPISAVAVGLAGWFLWPMRTKMRIIRRAGLAGIIVLALVMKAPVWYLPTHFSFGGDAWHRSYLMEISFQHLKEWWLWGMPLAQTADWFPYNLGSLNQADITNQFLAFGLAGGFLAIILFVLLPVKCYKSLSIAMRTVRSSFSKPAETELLLWGLGVMLSVHIVNWFAISYFDQTYVLWFMQLAAIVNISQICGRSHLRGTRQPACVQYATSRPTLTG